MNKTEKIRIDIGDIPIGPRAEDRRYRSGWEWENEDGSPREDPELFFTEEQLNEVVIESPEIVIEYTYPLSGKWYFEFRREGGWTRKSLIDQICEQYHAIYDEENGTSSVKEQSCAEAGQGTLINRVQTDGKYGIWGHVIGDLVLEGVSVEMVPRLEAVTLYGVGTTGDAVPLVHLSVGS